MKETFIVRTEWADAIFDLDSEQKATIFDNLFHYHLGNENLINLNNPMVKLVWKLIQPNLIRNIDQYDKRRETSSENGKKGGRPPKVPVLDENNLNNLTENLNKPNKALSVSVSVLESESDSVIVVTPEPKNEIPEVTEFVQQQQQQFKQEVENGKLFDIQQTKEYFLTDNEVWRQFRKWTDITHREIFEKVLNEFLKVEIGNEGNIYPRPKGKSLFHFQSWTKKRLADTPKLFTIEKEEEKKKIYVATSAEETPEQKAIRKQREQDEIDAIRKLKEESDRRQTDTNAKPKTLNDFLPNFLSA